MVWPEPNPFRELDADSVIPVTILLVNAVAVLSEDRFLARSMSIGRKT